MTQLHEISAHKSNQRPEDAEKQRSERKKAWVLWIAACSAVLGACCGAAVISCIALALGLWR